MNGRIYDPVLGRFLQADPFVQAPKNSQSLNRYSYVFNNPLSYTDPSGYEGILIGSIVTSFFTFLADRLSHDNQDIQPQETLIDGLTKSATPGVLPGAFGNGLSQEHRDLFTQTSPVAATIGNTSTEQTGRKFANGGDSVSFFELVGEAFSLYGADILRDSIDLTAGRIDESLGGNVGQTALDVTGVGPGIEAAASALDGDWSGVGIATSGVLLGKARIVSGIAIKGGKTVLGKFPDYISHANGLGARRFDVPPEIWARMTKAEQWASNKKFLDRMIKRGDDIILSNPVKNVNEVTGSFRQELDYLINQGYRLNADGTRLIR